MQICFVVRSQAEKWRDLLAGLRFDPDTMPLRFRSGVDVWIAQTYLRCAESIEKLTGQPPIFTDRFQNGTICVVHRDDLNDFRLNLYASTLVGVRADRPPVCVAEHVVVQNALENEVMGQHFIPHWPQPGLISRDSRRGHTLKRLGYLGRMGTVPHWFSDPAFHASLANLGIEFVCMEHDWYDYSAIDLVLAYREEAPTMLKHKPATKLYNAWLAGVPALLGAEPAYCEIRKSDLDFIPIKCVEDVLSAIKALQENPSRYQAMIENGRVRSLEYNVDAIQRRWLDYFSDTVLPTHLQRTNFPQGKSVGRTKFFYRMMQQKMASKPFKSKIRHELEVIARSR